MHAPDQMFCPDDAVLLFYYFVFIIIIIIIVRFLFAYDVCVFVQRGLSLICKLWKSIKTFNNILKLPDLYLRLSHSSFFTPFLVRDGV